MLIDEVQTLLNAEYEKGIEFMKQKMLSVCDTNKPIEIAGKAYFCVSAETHLHKLFDDIEHNCNTSICRSTIIPEKRKN